VTEGGFEDGDLLAVLEQRQMQVRAHRQRQK
jgi:hypothetical protein